MAAMDGVELHGAHGYLIEQFMSPKTNQRTDAYGGGFESRMRFAKEIVEGIKTQCGRDYPVIMRLSIDEFVAGGLQWKRVSGSQSIWKKLAWMPSMSAAGRLTA